MIHLDKVSKVYPGTKVPAVEDLSRRAIERLPESGHSAGVAGTGLQLGGQDSSKAAPRGVYAESGLI